MFYIILTKPCEGFYVKQDKIEIWNRILWSTYGLIGQVKDVAVEECCLPLLYRDLSLSVSEVGTS